MFCVPVSMYCMLDFIDIAFNLDHKQNRPQRELRALTHRVMNTRPASYCWRERVKGGDQPVDRRKDGEGVKGKVLKRLTRIKATLALHREQETTLIDSFVVDHLCDKTAALAQSMK